MIDAREARDRSVAHYKPCGEARRVGLDATGEPVTWTIETQCSDCGRWKRESDNELAYGLSGRAYCLRCVAESGGIPRPVRGRAAVKIDVRVPDLYGAAKLADFKPTIRKVLEGWPDRTPLLYCVGPTGHGKSHAGWALVNTLAARGLRVTHAYANRLKESYAACDSLQRSKLADKHRDAAFLIWDDLTSAADSPGWGAWVHEVLDSRMREARPMLLISTATPDQVGALLGDGIRSRLSQFHWLDFRPNGDWRAKAGESRKHRSEP